MVCSDIFNGSVRLCTIGDKMITYPILTLWHKITTYEKLFWNNYFPKITNLTRNSLKKSLFPADFEGTNSLKNYEKQLSGNYFRNNFVSEGTFICAPMVCSDIFYGSVRLCVYHWRQNNYLPNLYSWQIILGKSMCLLLWKGTPRGTT